MLSLSIKLSNKFDTDQLFAYILNIQKMCHQHQPSSSFIVWTFFKCFDRDLRELKQNNKFDTNQLFHYTRNPASRASERVRLVAIRPSSYVHRTWETTGEAFLTAF